MTKEEKKDFVLDAFTFRHACKRFDETHAISKEDMAFILETGRLSPTSFGMQGVRLLVITNKELKASIKKVCWSQPQIDSCSHLVIYLTKTADLQPDTPWVKSRFADRQMPLEKQQAYYEVYHGFHEDLSSRIEGYFKRKAVSFFYRLFHKKRDPKDIYQWGARQAYILLANMMSSASMIGVDSCPIEGFDKNRLEALLGIDTQQEEIAVVATYGYRVAEASQKLRLPLEDIVEYRE
jgi:nitroreductase